MAVTITGIQRKPEYVGSNKGYSDYDDYSHCQELAVKRVDCGGKASFELFFPQLNNPNEGVGLGFPSPEIAVAVGRALLTVAEGCAEEVTVHF